MKNADVSATEQKCHIHLETTQKKQPYRTLVIFRTLTFRKKNSEKATTQNTTNIQGIDI